MLNLKEEVFFYSLTYDIIFFFNLTLNLEFICWADYNELNEKNDIYMIMKFFFIFV